MKQYTRMPQHTVSATVETSEAMRPPHASVSATPLTVCPKCGKPVRQDEDTLDTWFSSALWPFSTLGWPEETEDLKYFYPTNTLVTGYDIITFWVSRMIFSGLTYTDKAPFDTVLIHGLVRDSTTLWFLANALVTRS